MSLMATQDQSRLLETSVKYVAATLGFRKSNTTLYVRKKPKFIMFPHGRIVFPPQGIHSGVSCSLVCHAKFCHVNKIFKIGEYYLVNTDRLTVTRFLTPTT